ncbi:H/ACA ribonucleoprotein complex non-core subunit NAF1 [Dendropsophus ebraccatus]|uniref:H/ACA ribonucleoprotein complex non-core subunit NAF1 n=1 Tax=Dendropsophus ebraccatus TaxID=150705 RepID=UPI0038314D8C
MSTMETQEAMALLEATGDELQNNNNLLGGEDEKTSITESNTPDKTPLPVYNDDIIHTIIEKTQVISREEDASKDNGEVRILPQAAEVSDGDRQTVQIQSLPCILQPQQSDMEVAEQLEGLHFKNRTIGEHEDVVRIDCPPACVKIVSEAYEEEDSTSEDSSSDSDSDSDSSSSSSTSSSSSSSMSSIIQLEEEPLENTDVPLKTKDELLVDELPPVEELSINLPDHVELKPFGTVSSVIEQLVIIESLRDILPLNEDTVVFKEDRTVVGKIFEIFGPVPHPFYVIRFNSKEQIESSGIKIKDAMFFAPSVQDFTQYIIPDALKRDKGSDASWTNDQEPPPDVIDYSDDEKEREAKQKKKAQNPGKKKQKFDQDKPSTSSQVSQQVSRPYGRNGSAPRFSQGRGSHPQENSYGQHHQSYYSSGYPGHHMMQQSYTYHNVNSQEYSMPLSNNGYQAPMPNFFGHYGNMQAFPPPPPPPDINWPAPNLHYPYMSSSHLYNLPPPPPPPPPPAPPNSGEPSY